MKGDRGQAVEGFSAGGGFEVPSDGRRWPPRGAEAGTVLARGLSGADGLGAQANGMAQRTSGRGGRRLPTPNGPHQPLSQKRPEWTRDEGAFRAPGG